MFGLKVNYSDIICNIIDLFMKHEKVSVLLVPHVFTTKGHVESDQDACLAVYKALQGKYEQRVFIVHHKYDQNEIKYIVGMCDFFVGSRMHACIAALSQGIPAVGLAYSKKFYGVFGSIGLSDCVVDVRSCEERETLEKLVSLFKCREQIHKHLLDVMPKVSDDILSIFGYVSLRQFGDNNSE
jgi:polysaccharide pyruvyl transferase WcaK-like protein